MGTNVVFLKVEVGAQTKEYENYWFILMEVFRLTYRLSVKVVSYRTVTVSLTCSVAPNDLCTHGPALFSQEKDAV